MAGQAGVWRYRSQCSVLPHRTTTQQVVQVKVEVQVERQVKVDGRLFEDTTEVLRCKLDHFIGC